MSTMCMRPTDCLAGRRAAFGARRGVRAAAPALAPRSPMEQQRQHESQTLGMVVNSRAAHGRANGQQQQQRRRRSPPASGAGSGSGSPPHKRVMENVVILRRGQVLMDVATAAQLTATDSAAAPSVKQTVEEKAETGPAGKDAGAGVAAEARRGEQEKVDESSVATAKQSSESVATVDQGGAREEAAETPVAADNVGAETKEDEPVVTTNQSGAATKEKCEVVAAVDQCGAQEAAVETAVAADNVGTETTEEETVVTTNQSGAETTTEENEPEVGAGESGAQVETAEPAASVDQHGRPDTREKEAEPAEHRGADTIKAEPAAPAAHQALPLAKEEAEQAYSGASFAAVAPDPRALPIPVRLLKLPRGSAAPRFRVLALDNDRAPAPTAAAA